MGLVKKRNKQKKKKLASVIREAERKRYRERMHKQETLIPIKEDRCDKCGTINPERCDGGPGYMGSGVKAHSCMVCVGRETAGSGRCNFCRGCLLCNGLSFGTYCYACDDDD